MVCSHGMPLTPRPPRVGRRFRPLRSAATAGAADGAAAASEPDAPTSVMQELLALAREAEAPGAPTSSWDALLARVNEDLAKISPEAITELQMELSQKAASDAPELSSGTETLVKAIQTAVESRMAAAKEDLERLIENNSGNVNKDVQKVLKRQESPLPLLMVLRLNIEQAQRDGDEDKVRACMHINTVVNEELEKKAPRVGGMLNRLLRMEDAGIRQNILRHHLTPVEVGVVAGDDDTPGLMAAPVPPSRLADAISDLVTNINLQLKVGGGDVDEMRFDTIDRVREIAKEARFVIHELYGEGAMNDFGAALTPAFRELMAHKAKVEKAARESEEAQKQPEEASPVST